MCEAAAPMGQTGMTVGIDARAAVEVAAGRGRVVRELLRSLSRRREDGTCYVLYARRPWQEIPLDERFRWQLIPARDPWWHVVTARRANRECDVFLSTNSYLTVCLTRIPTVPIVYDLVAFEPTMRPNRRSTVIERFTLAPAARRAAAFIAISQATADELVRRIPATSERTTVAHLGAGPTPLHAPSPDQLAALPAPGFVLAVGTLEPRKNLPRLVDAYQLLDPALQRNHRLVVVGARGWEMSESLTSLQGLGERCVMLGYVDDAVLAELYKRCGVFCYPSLGEGFGLPVLEAMAAGAAVVTSNVSSLPEVAGDAAEYADPLQASSIAEALRHVLTDERHRRELQERALERSRGFSWGSFAEIVLRVLQEASTRS